MPTTGWETIVKGNGPRTLVLIPGARDAAHAADSISAGGSLVFTPEDLRDLGPLAVPAK